MVRKTKKTNKRKYSTGSQRNHSITRNKRMYGGYYDNEVAVNNDEVNNDEVNNDEQAANEILEKIEEQNKIEFSKIPFIGPVIEKTGNLIEGASVNAIDKAGELLGVDIEHPGSVSEKLDNVKAALSNPGNLEKMKEIAGEAGKIGEVAVIALKPAAEKFVDTTLPVVTDGITKTFKGALATGVNLAEDVAGPLIGIPRTLLSAATAFNASVNAGSELVKGASEAIQGSQENFERLMDNANIPEVPEMPSIKTPTMNYNLPNASEPIKNLQKAAIMVGGRIKKSQLEFLSPFVNRAQIFKQYGGKLNTKKHRNSNRNRNSKTVRRK